MCNRNSTKKRQQQTNQPTKQQETIKKILNNENTFIHLKNIE